MLKKDLTKPICVAILVTGLSAVLITNNRAIRTTKAFSAGPPAGSTGAPLEVTCSNCHFNSGGSNNGQFAISAPPTYVPGQTYQVTVTHTNLDVTRKRWGFQLTALNAANNKAGDLQNLNVFCQVLNNDPALNRQYIEHTQSGTFAGQTGGASWTFNWTAPASDVGTITFYAAGNQANNDSQPSGDQIYVTSVSSPAATPTPTPTPALGTVQFNASTYTVGEGDGSATITVTRSGDTTGVSSVDFATSDGTASQRNKYTVTVGTLTFNPGDSSKTFSVPIVDEAFVEGNQTVNLTLSNPLNATLGSPGTAMLTIIDNDTAQSILPPAKRFAANFSGGQETPPNSSSGTGQGYVLLSQDETTGMASLQFSNLSSSETAAHIHGPGAVGVAAPIIFPLPIGNPVTDLQIHPTMQQVADLKAGLHYMNVHSTLFANGEIRGQLLSNPTLDDTFFVRQHYLDFLGREPDPGGFTFWVNRFNQNCGSGVQCFHDNSIAVSNAFYFELEFQQTGAYVYRLYRAAYGNAQPFPNPGPDTSPPGLILAAQVPNYAVFVADRARVVGSANLAQSLQALANLFVTRTEFINRYPASLATGAQFVDAVLATLQNDLSVNLQTQRQALIDQYSNAGGGNAGRAMVVFRLGQDDSAGNPINNRPFVDAEYNRAFVVTQYFGYLRRDGDMGGLNFWFGQVNSAPLRDTSKQNAMVCSFITAEEYQQRFGPNAPRNNKECQ